MSESPTLRYQVEPKSPEERRISIEAKLAAASIDPAELLLPSSLRAVGGAVESVKDAADRVNGVNQ